VLWFGGLGGWLGRRQEALLLLLRLLLRLLL
jgi:hypothetical protein